MRATLSTLKEFRKEREKEKEAMKAKEAERAALREKERKERESALATLQSTMAKKKEVLEEAKQS